MRAFQIVQMTVLATGLLGGQAAGQSQGAGTFLSVQSVVFDQTISDLKVTVRNVGNKRITGFAILVSSSQYTEDYFGSIGQEAKLTFPRPPGFGGILPGEAVEFLFPAKADQAATAEINAVIFDDRTAAGDEDQIAYLFRGRLGHASEWQRWAPSMRPGTFDIAPTIFDEARKGVIARLQRATSAGDDPATATGEAMARHELIGLMKQVTADSSHVILQHIQDVSAVLQEHSKRQTGAPK
jgi:hypothetical protein